MKIYDSVLQAYVSAVSVCVCVCVCMCVVPGIGPAVLTAHRDTVIVHAIGPPVLTAHKDTVLHLCVCCTWDGTGGTYSSVVHGIGTTLLTAQLYMG